MGDARMPVKISWMRRQRALRRLLRKLRKARKIDKNLYHKFYLGSKGNLYKNKKVLIEAIHRERNEKLRQLARHLLVGGFGFWFLNFNVDILIIDNPLEKIEVLKLQ